MKKSKLAVFIAGVTFSLSSTSSFSNTLTHYEIEQWLDEQEKIVNERDDAQMEMIKHEILSGLTETEIESYEDNIFGINEVPVMVGPSGLSQFEFSRRIKDNQNCQHDECNENDYVLLDFNPLYRIDELLQVAIYNEQENNYAVNIFGILDQHRERLNVLLHNALESAQIIYTNTKQDQLIKDVVEQVFEEMPTDIPLESKIRSLIYLSGNSQFNPEGGVGEIYQYWLNAFFSNQQDTKFFALSDVPMLKAYAAYIMGMYQIQFGESEAQRFYTKNGTNSSKLLAAIMNLSNKFEVAYLPRINKTTGIPDNLPTLLEFSSKIGSSILINRSAAPQAGMQREVPCEMSASAHEYAYGDKTIQILLKDCIQPRFDNDYTRLTQAFENRRSDFLYPQPEPSEFQEMLNFAFSIAEIASISKGFLKITKGRFSGAPRSRVSLKIAKAKRPSGNSLKPRVNQIKSTSSSRTFKNNFNHYKSKYSSLQQGQTRISQVGGKQTTFTLDSSGKISAYQRAWGNRYYKYTENGLEGTFIKNRQGQFEHNATNGIGGGSGNRFRGERPKKLTAQQIDNLDGGHSIARHGPQISNKKLKERIKKGQAPDNRFSPADDSTRFLDEKTWLDTRRFAFERIQERAGVDFGPDFKKVPAQPPAQAYQIYVNHGKKVGVGYQGYGNRTLQKSKLSQGENGRRPKKTHQLENVKFNDNVQITRTTIEWDTTKKRWVVRQHHPAFGLAARETDYIMNEIIEPL
ncbi:hypothetical protein [Spartinivicinus ruber]|uniref:hypothetical protein n=1 Tax=Spartinivicinus ruber TaxID=2683272 RepID=UPI0013D6B7C2|nr:hypothetical protein [Spartinivicinus ruber]